MMVILAYHDQYKEFIERCLLPAEPQSLLDWLQEATEPRNSRLEEFKQLGLVVMEQASAETVADVRIRGERLAGHQRHER